MLKKLKTISKKTKATITFLVVLALMLPVVTIATGCSASNRIKNIILMVPDGMSLSATTLARFMQPDNPDQPEEAWTFTGERRLAMDQHVQGLVRTTWAGGPITDSAPAGTAMATGHKSNNLRIGLDANDDPRATVMQAARSIGMSTGLVMNSEFMHATPAAFMSHEVARFNYDNLARQILGNRPNVVLGTGSAQVRSFNEYSRGLPESFDPETQSYTIVADGYKRLDLPGNPGGGVRLVNAEGYTVDSSRRRIVLQNTWMQHVANEGYQVVRTRAQMNTLLRPTSTNALDLRVWGDFNGGLTMLGENYRYLSYDIDRRLRPDLGEPSVAEMTAKAIELLSSNRNGFFLLVEGSKIDWAAHVHDAVALTSDILAFDRAFEVALDFAKRCGNTIVVLASDHATGGLTISSSDLSFDIPGASGIGPWTFDEAPWEMLAPLRRAVMGAGRSTEAALQLFVTGRTRVWHPQQGYIDWADNHNEVLAAYGIDYAFWDYYASRADLDELAEHLYTYHLTAPGQVRRVHGMIEGFRTAFPSSGVVAVPGQEHLRGNGMQFLSSANLQDAQRQLAAIMNQKSFITFSSNWHSGDDVPFYMYAPRGFSHQELLGRRSNHIENTDIALMLANAMQVNLQSLTDDLFVEIYQDGESLIEGVDVTFTQARFQSNFTREGTPDQNNASSWVDVVFTITSGSNTVTLTAGNNYFILNGKRVTYDVGVNVYFMNKPQSVQPALWTITGINADRGRLFVPRLLLDSLR